MGMVRIDIFYQRGSKIPFFLEVPMYGRCPTFDQYVLRHSSHTIPEKWKGRTISKVPGGCKRISSICRREGISSLRIKFEPSGRITAPKTKTVHTDSA